MSICIKYICEIHTGNRTQTDQELKVHLNSSCYLQIRGLKGARSALPQNDLGIISIRISNASAPSIQAGEEPVVSDTAGTRGTVSNSSSPMAHVWALLRVFLSCPGCKSCLHGCEELEGIYTERIFKRYYTSECYCCAPTVQKCFFFLKKDPFYFHLTKDYQE